MNFFKTVYIIRSSFFNDTIGQRLEPMFLLKEKRESGKMIVIETRKYPNIALVSNPETTRDTELISKGAETKLSKEVFNDEIDAKLQMAFIAAKVGVSDDEIYENTYGALLPEQYKRLKELFYKDFPEKFI